MVFLLGIASALSPTLIESTISSLLPYRAMYILECAMACETSLTGSGTCYWITRWMATEAKSSDSFMYHSSINSHTHVQYQDGRFTTFPHSSLVEYCIFVCLILFYIYTLKLTLFWTSFACVCDFVGRRKDIWISFSLNPIRADPFHAWA